MSDAKKTLMQISTCKIGGVDGRPILTIELDGSVTYHEPMTQAELKTMLEDMLQSGVFASPMASQVVMAMLFGSELARLNAENEELKRRIGPPPPVYPPDVYVCSLCGPTSNPHICLGRRPSP